MNMPQPYGSSSLLIPPFCKVSEQKVSQASQICVSLQSLYGKRESPAYLSQEKKQTAKRTIQSQSIPHATIAPLDFSILL